VPVGLVLLRLVLLRLLLLGSVFLGLTVLFRPLLGGWRGAALPLRLQPLRSLGPRGGCGRWRGSRCRRGRRAFRFYWPLCGSGRRCRVLGAPGPLSGCHGWRWVLGASGALGAFCRRGGRGGRGRRLRALRAARMLLRGSGGRRSPVGRRAVGRRHRGGALLELRSCHGGRRNRAGRRNSFARRPQRRRRTGSGRGRDRRSHEHIGARGRCTRAQRGERGSVERATGLRSERLLARGERHGRRRRRAAHHDGASRHHGGGPSHRHDLRLRQHVPITVACSIRSRGTTRTLRPTGRDCTKVCCDTTVTAPGAARLR